MHIAPPPPSRWPRSDTTLDAAANKLLGIVSRTRGPAFVKTSNSLLLPRGGASPSLHPLLRATTNRRRFRACNGRGALHRDAPLPKSPTTPAVLRVHTLRRDRRTSAQP